jgi:hypothetical protein
MKPPKNVAKYESGLVAGMKLLSLCLEKIFGARDGVKVKWSITVYYWNDDWTDPEKTKDMKVLPLSGSFSNL